MTPRKREQYRRRLEALEAELLSRGPARIESDHVGPREAVRDEDAQPLNEMLQSIASGRNRNHDAVLLRVRRALAKLQEDPELFGLCEDCEEPIAHARLDAQPHAPMCVACQTRREGPRNLPTRRHLTDLS
jgi:DnaK suppressor protein